MGLGEAFMVGSSHGTEEITQAEIPSKLLHACNQ